MSKLPPLPHWCESGSPFAEQMQAYATAATEPLLQRIAELEQRNSDLHEDVQRFKKHALNEKAARLELERQLEEARNQTLEAFDSAVESARLLGGTQYKKGFGSYTEDDARFELAMNQAIAKHRAAIQKGQS